MKAITIIFNDFIYKRRLARYISIVKNTIKKQKKRKNISYPKYIELKVNIYKSIVYLKPVIKSVYRRKYIL